MAGKSVISDGEDEVEVQRVEEEPEDCVDDDGKEGEEDNLAKGLGPDPDFDPEILSEMYTTQADDLILETDIPERMQLSELITGPPPTDEMSIEEESSWIYNQLFNSKPPLVRGSTMKGFNTDKEVMLNDISRFLELMHVQKLDIPFIAMYRREECLSLFNDTEQLNSEKPPTVRWHKVLWAIHDLDKRWLSIQKRKSDLASTYEKRFFDELQKNNVEARRQINCLLSGSIKRYLKDAESERDIEDVHLMFKLHFPTGEHDAVDGQYSICSKAGLWLLASKFGYEQHGVRIRQERMLPYEDIDESEDAKETPEKVASNFTCEMFSTPEDVLTGARHMAAVELSCETITRKCGRTTFMESAVVSTSPTTEGDTTIDKFHRFAGVKWLRDKPLGKFQDAQWLLIQKAEEEKLLKVNILLPSLVVDHLISSTMDLYLSPSVSKYAQLWNEQRILIIKDALKKYFLPSMEKEVRLSLESRAKSWLSMEYGKLLWNRVSVAAPYQRKETEPRVMACCWGPGNPATTFVMLDSSGEFLDVMYAPSLGLCGQSANDRQREKNDQDGVLAFIMRYQPHVVVLGAANRSCVKLQHAINEIVFKMGEDNLREDGFEMDFLPVVYGDESLPHIYENSVISTGQLPEQLPGIVRRAVALGRYLQNPLAMVAALCGVRREILSWKLGSMDGYLSDDDKYNMVEHVMVDLTNQIGLDLNLAASHEWLFAPLQFISGLGPRKAAYLQRSLVKSGAIYKRKDLPYHGLGEKVFENAVGFLRVRNSGSAASDEQRIKPFNDMRIHPESHWLAGELLKAVISNDGVDDDLLEMAAETPLSIKLKRFNTDKFAEKWNFQNKKETLRLIKLELMDGFRDWRIPYAAADLEALKRNHDWRIPYAAADLEALRRSHLESYLHEMIKKLREVYPVFLSHSEVLQLLVIFKKIEDQIYDGSGEACIDKLAEIKKTIDSMGEIKDLYVELGDPALGPVGPVYEPAIAFKPCSPASNKLVFKLMRIFIESNSYEGRMTYQYPPKLVAASFFHNLADNEISFQDSFAFVKKFCDYIDVDEPHLYVKDVKEKEWSRTQAERICKFVAKLAEIEFLDLKFPGMLSISGASSERESESELKFLGVLIEALVPLMDLKMLQTFIARYICSSEE